MKRILTLALAMVMALTMLFSSVGLAADPIPPRIAPEGETITLNVFNWAHQLNSGVFGEQQLWSYLEEHTGIHLEFETYYSDAAEKMALKLASNQLPDMFFRIRRNNPDILKYANDDVFAPISPYLEEYAPNYSREIDAIVGLRETMTMENGNIYGFAYLLTGTTVQTSPIFYNQSWLDQLGMEMATDLKGFKELLIAVRDTDLNGNGDPSDEIPYAGIGIGSIYVTLMGSFGLGTKGRNLPVDLGTDGALRYIPTAPEYRELMRYMNELYTEGLIHREVFTTDHAAFTGLAEQNLVFMSMAAASDYFGSYTSDYAGLQEPFTGFNGEKLWAIRNSANGGQNTFITTANAYPAETVQWLDYLYTDDGMRLYFMGFEGVTYDYDDQGNAQYTDLIAKHPDGLSTEEALSKYVAWSGGSNPSIAEDKYWGSVLPELDQNTCRSLLQYAPDEVWREFNYSEADTTRMTTLSTDIETYVEDMRAKFITGNASLDNDWDTYVATLERMGLNEMIEIYGRGYDNYKALSK